MQVTQRISGRRNLARTFCTGASLLCTFGIAQTTQAGQPTVPLSNQGDWVTSTEPQYVELPYPIATQQVSGAPDYGPLWNDYHSERGPMEKSGCNCGQCTSKQKSPLRKFMSKLSSGFDRFMFGTSNNATCDSCSHGEEVSCDAESGSACDAMGTSPMETRTAPLELAPIEPIVPIFDDAQPLIQQTPHSPVRTQVAPPQNGKQRPQGGVLEKRIPQPPQQIPSQLTDPFQDDPISTAPGGPVKRAGYFD